MARKGDLVEARRKLALRAKQLKMRSAIAEARASLRDVNALLRKRRRTTP